MKGGVCSNYAYITQHTGWQSGGVDRGIKGMLEGTEDRGMDGGGEEEREQRVVCEQPGHRVSSYGSAKVVVVPHFHEWKNKAVSERVCVSEQVSGVKHEAGIKNIWVSAHCPAPISLQYRSRAQGMIQPKYVADMPINPAWKRVNSITNLVKPSYYCFPSQCHFHFHS